MYYFFFQAEDGIRDYKVTGVQTCALPIYLLGEDGQRYISWVPVFLPKTAFNIDRKSTRLNSSHLVISYAVFCLKKKESCCSASSGSRRGPWLSRGETLSLPLKRPML